MLRFKVEQNYNNKQTKHWTYLYLQSKQEGLLHFCSLEDRAPDQSHKFKIEKYERRWRVNNMSPLYRSASENNLPFVPSSLQMHKYGAFRNLVEFFFNINTFYKVIYSSRNIQYITAWYISTCHNVSLGQKLFLPENSGILIFAIFLLWTGNFFC